MLAVNKDKEVEWEYVDIDFVNSEKFLSVDDYIVKTYEDRIIPTDKFSIGRVDTQIYQLRNSNSVKVFLEQNDHIFNISSPLESFLVEILSTFRFVETSP